MKDVLESPISQGDYVTYWFKPGSAEGGHVVALVEELDDQAERLKVKVISFTYGPLTKPLFDRKTGKFPPREPFRTNVSPQNVIVITDHPFMKMFKEKQGT